MGKIIVNRITILLLLIPTPMYSFIREIPYDKWSLIMQFTKVHAPQEKFFVVVNDGEIDVISFEVVKDKRNSWKISHPAPEWIFNLEDQIADSINENTIIPQELHPLSMR